MKVVRKNLLKSMWVSMGIRGFLLVPIISLKIATLKGSPIKHCTIDQEDYDIILCEVNCSGLSGGKKTIFYCRYEIMN